jgi:hypothetical protein
MAGERRARVGWLVAGRRFDRWPQKPSELVGSRMRTSSNLPRRPTRTWWVAAAIAVLICAAPCQVPACVGDCKGAGRVDIADLIIGVNIVLGLAPVGDCSAFATTEGQVTIARLIEGVNNVLYGCGATPTPRSPSPGTTATSLPSGSSTPAPTATPGGRFVDNGDGTIADTQTTLMWEKKLGAGSGSDAANLHDADNSYSWSGQCSLSSDVGCQPNPAAALACAAGAQGNQAGCGTCQVGHGTCAVNPPGITTIWDWVAELNTANFAGHSDWRIPTPAELASIVDYAAMLPAVDGAFNGVGCGATCLDPTSAACSCTQIGGFWTATLASDDSHSARIVSFDTGFVDFADRSLPYVYVRAVRGGGPAPTPRFIDTGNGTVTDMQTKLIWEKKVGLGAGADAPSLHAADNFYTWAGACSQPSPRVLCQPNPAAAAACAQRTQGDPKGCAMCTAEQGTCNADPDGLGVLSTIWDWLVQLNAAAFAGHTDWRVPTVAEMESLVDYVAPPPGIDSAFDGPSCAPTCTDVTSAACSCTQPDPYWTATSDANGPPLAWVTDFLFDRTTPVAKSGLNVVYVRAVRGGPPTTAAQTP